MNILFEDDYILACEKPAGIATQAGRVTEKDMVSEVNNHMRKAGAKAPAYLIHRLDKPVKGVLLFAKNKQAAASLNKQLTTDNFEKKYYALIEGRPEKASAKLSDNIYKDGNRAYIADIKQTEEQHEIKHAELMYSVASNDIRDKVFSDYVSDENIENTACLEIKLLTGRFHQIRCQLSNISHPIVGDSLYGSKIECEKRKAIGLIAYSLSFKHPKTNKNMKFELDFN